MTIYEIKQRTQKTAPYFFDTKTLKFFGQTLKSFRVFKVNEHTYKIVAPVFSRIKHKVTHYTVRYFDTNTNRLTKNIG